MMPNSSFSVRISLRWFRDVLILFIIGFVIIAAINHSFYLLTNNNPTLHMGDYAIFAEMTRTLTSGEQLYVDYWDIKPPGLFFFLAPFVLLFGNTVLALQIGTFVCILLFIGSMTGLTYQLTHSKTAALGACLLAALYSGRETGPETTFVMATMGLISTWLSVQGAGRPVWMLATGATFAFGVLTKQPLAFALPALIAFAVWKANDHKRRAILYILGGMVLVGVLVFVWAISQGILNTMIDRLFAVSSQYVLAKDGNWHFRPDSGALFETYFLGQVIPEMQLLFILGAFSAPFVLFKQNARTLLLLTLFWFLLSFVAASIPRGWRADYFTQIVPPLILLIALALPHTRTLRVYVQIIFLSLSIVLLVRFYVSIVEPRTQAYLTKPMPDEEHVLNLINENANSDSCIWMWGNMAYFNYLSGIDSCTTGAHNGFVMDDTTFPIVRLRTETIHELLTSNPELHVRDRIWGYFSQLETYAERYLDERVGGAEQYEVFTVDRSMWHTADANFDNEIRFIGYDLLPVDGPYCPGDTLTLAMTWQQISTPTEQYQMFVHLLTQDETARLASYDGPPEDDLRSNATNTWVDEGEIRLGERFAMAIPADAEPGTYKLVVGLYDVEAPDQRLPVLDTNGAQVGSYAVLQELRIDHCL